jgi:hypothetical protein
LRDNYCHVILSDDFVALVVRRARKCDYSM